MAKMIIDTGEYSKEIELSKEAAETMIEEQIKSERERDAVYQKGLNDAWEAARKIETMTNLECCDAFQVSDGFILNQTTASEAIEKLKAYEQQNEIRVGDEVVWEGDKGVVTKIVTDGKTFLMLDAYGGWLLRIKKQEAVKTGRHFPQVAELLKQMQEDE